MWGEEKGTGLVHHWQVTFISMQPLFIIVSLSVPKLVFLSEFTEGRSHVLFLFIYSHIMQNYASHLIYRIEMQGAQNTSALVSLGSCDEVSQAGWLRTAEVYWLTVLEVRNLKSRCF